MLCFNSDVLSFKAYNVSINNVVSDTSSSRKHSLQSINDTTNLSNDLNEVRIFKMLTF